MASLTLKPPGIFSMFQGRESTHGYYSIWQNLLCYEVGLTGGGNEGYHAVSSHGGLPDAALHGSSHGGGLHGHPSGLRRTLPNSRARPARGPRRSFFLTSDYRVARAAFDEERSPAHAGWGGAGLPTPTHGRGHKGLLAERAAISNRLEQKHPDAAAVP